MPGAIGPRIGFDCALYYKTTISNTIASSGTVLITEAQDVSLSTSHGKIETPSRASSWKSKVPGLSEMTLNFSYLYQGDPGDTVFAALRGAYLAKTPLHWFFMDNVITAPGTAGAQGIVFPGIIFDFPIDQPLEGALKVDFGVELTRVKDGSNLVNPAWFIVAPT